MVDYEEIYKRSEKTFGLAEFPPQDLRYNYSYIDLTQSQEDIGTLDGIDSMETKTIWKDEFEMNYNGTKDEYNRRFEKKINQSINSNACRKYVGMPEVENETVK